MKTSILTDARTAYSKWAKYFAEKSSENRARRRKIHFFTPKNHRIDVAFRKNSALVLKNGISSVEFFYEDAEKPVEKIQISKFTPDQLDIILYGLNNIENELSISGEKFRKNALAQISQNVNYIISRFEAGYISGNVRKIRLNVLTDFLPEFHNCLEFTDSKGVFLIDLDEGKLISTSSHCKYRTRILDDEQLSRISSLDLSYINRIVEEAARTTFLKA